MVWGWELMVVYVLDCWKCYKFGGVLGFVFFYGNDNWECCWCEIYSGRKIVWVMRKYINYWVWSDELFNLLLGVWRGKWNKFLWFLFWVW